MKMAGFSVERMSSYETGDKSLYESQQYLVFARRNSTAAGVEKARAPCMFLTTHTGECTVTACRTEL